jgi:ribosome-binding factor A
MSLRIKRVEEAIRRELGSIITRNLTFEEGMATIHDVSIAPDLRHCDIYLGVVPAGKQAKGVLRKLEDNRKMLQSALSKRVILKYTPHLHFHLDDSVERGVRVLQIMQDIPEPLEPDAEDPAEEWDEDHDDHDDPDDHDPRS